MAVTIDCPKSMDREEN